MKGIFLAEKVLATLKKNLPNLRFRCCFVAKFSLWNPVNHDYPHLKKNESDPVVDLWPRKTQVKTQKNGQCSARTQQNS